MLCTPKPIYEGCRDLNGNRSQIELFGGTSESAPLTAGEAALVIQAYRKTHAGASPSVALVKQIITSTATDLGEPGYEQGAGLIDSLRVVSGRDVLGESVHHIRIRTADFPVISVVACAAWNREHVRYHGDECWSPRPDGNAVGFTQDPPFSTASYVSIFAPKSDPKFVDYGGNKIPYVTQRFMFPPAPRGLTWPSAGSSANGNGSGLAETLFDPSGNLSAYSFPQGPGSGYGHVDVRNPAPGRWTAEIWSPAEEAGFHGPARLAIACSRFGPAGTVSPPSRMLAPGQQGKYSIRVATPLESGDFSDQVVFRGTPGSAAPVAGAIPVIVRSLIPIGPTGGTFSGQLEEEWPAGRPVHDSRIRCTAGET